MKKLIAGHVNSDNINGLGVIEFYHPQSNSLPGEVLRQLAEAITRAGNDPEVKVILLKSYGEKTFCAGASFDELASIRDEVEGKQFFMGFAHVINAMRKAPKFIIGRVQGKCVGGGVGLAAAVDYCIATEAADIKLSELAIGLGPFVVGPAVERKIGTASFSQLAINAGSWQKSTWARDKGLFSELHPGIEEMNFAVEKLAGSLLLSNPDAMAEMKKICWAGTEHWDELLASRAAISGKLVLSEYTRNAVDRLRTK